MKRLLPSLAIGGLLALATPNLADAKIDFVTLPSRDTTQLTIYKAEDLTLVRERRELTFSEGLNEIQFSWAGTLIDPTSLQIDILSNPREYRLLDAKYPANTQNTVIWNFEATSAGSVTAEISYFASGVSWKADYKAIADDEEETLRIEPNYTISNNSGEDFENANTRLVVGDVNLVEAIADLARRGIIPTRGQVASRRAASKAMMRQETATLAFSALPATAPLDDLGVAEMDRIREVVKKAVSEYQLYSVSGTVDLDNKWSKQLPDPPLLEIPFDLSYEYNTRKFGNQVVKFYKFDNDEEHELGGTPLPGGMFYVFSGDGRGGLDFEASTAHKYVPVGEDVELMLGSDGRVLVDRRMMSVTRDNFDFDSSGNVVGHDVITEYEIEITNSRDRTVPFKMTDYYQGDFDVTEFSEDFKRVDQSTLEWELDLAPKAKKTISLTVVQHMGTRSKR